MSWRPIEDFPGYSVSREGQVRNDDTGRILALTRNQYGVIQVGLMQRKQQYKRGVALLVAKAFLPPPTPPIFNTPINLDGDRSNCDANNLMWRPRWFAIMYHQQFPIFEPSIDVPIVDLKNNRWYANSAEAVVQHGLLDREIRAAILNRTYVWPTYQEFKLNPE